MSESLASRAAHDRCADLQLWIGCCLYTSSSGRIPSMWSLLLVSTVFPDTHGSYFLLPAFVFLFLPLVKSPPILQGQLQKFVLMTNPSQSLLTPSARGHCCPVPGLPSWEAGGVDGPLCAEA